MTAERLGHVISCKIVLGLGNPGLRYRGTRHNVGFRVLDRLAGLHEIDFHDAPEARSRAWVAVVENGTERVVLAKARTYMNRSGRAAAALLRMYEVDPVHLIVVHDDADLALGRIRIRESGGAGGHNGIRSLIEVLGTDDFARIKLGVRGAEREEGDLADYVLSRFAADEQSDVRAMVERAAAAVGEILNSGLSTAMNLYNGRSASEQSGESRST